VKAHLASVGVIDGRGNIVAIITLDELARTGISQELYFRNFEHFGAVEFELLTLIHPH
jgi:hypothetical protein